MIRVVVVDDEPLGRRGIVSRLRKREGISIEAECANGREAIEAVRQFLPDLLFLDVQMPGLDGFDVVRELGRRCPPVIFVTAWNEHAVRAFEVHAFDYLLKPIDDVRFDEAVDRAIARLSQEKNGEFGRRVAELVQQLEPNAQTSGGRLAIRIKGRVILVRYEEIDWIESAGDYVRVHSRGKAWLMRQTLSRMEEELASRNFLRIHRSILVNPERVREVQAFESGDAIVVLEDGTELRLGRTYRRALERLSSV